MYFLTAMIGSASEMIVARTSPWNRGLVDNNWRYWIWFFCLICIVGPALKALMERRRRINLLWKLPGCNVNYILLYFAIAKTIVFRNQIKRNILTFQVLCGTTLLFYKEKMWRMWIGTKPWVILFKPETVEVILNSNTVLKKTFMYEFLNYWFKEGLITSSGSKWRMRRKLLTPAFHFRILSDFLPVIDEQSRVLVKVLEEQNGEEVDIVHPVTLCTLDILCETAMGIKIQAQRKILNTSMHLKYCVFYLNRKTQSFNTKMYFFRNSSCVFVASLDLVWASGQFSDRVIKPWVWSDFTYYMTEEGRNYKKNVSTMLQFTSARCSLLGQHGIVGR
ncbi:cytochrome P450 4V2 [Caerostris extrusa]|uniref:Cytochrome P450 4V2 n=1 Tax=Caerostris extrusa TaxID=172846 RepID=A0AAV4NHI4_CAEEX|nr:cytochrome P450 4V2 [Caerostris extrusa]